MMFFLFFLAFFNFSYTLAALNPPECGKRPLKPLLKIVGGNVAVKGDWGWQVSIKYGGGHHCGGTLLDNNWILSAAHCFEESLNPKHYTVQLGYHEREPFLGEKLKISVLVAHPQYSSVTLRHDLALLKLASPVSFSNTLLPACVQTSSASLANQTAWATGWGDTSEGGSMSSNKREVAMPILSDSQCVKNHRVNPAQQLCAGVPFAGKDTCQGDSGGPLVAQNSNNKLWYLVGVTSHGDGCEGGGVYGRVSFYIDWFNKIFAQYP